jgi:hypothetical protein
VTAKLFVVPAGGSHGGVFCVGTGGGVGTGVGVGVGMEGGVPRLPGGGVGVGAGVSITVVLLSIAGVPNAGSATERVNPVVSDVTPLGNTAGWNVKESSSEVSILKLVAASIYTPLPAVVSVRPLPDNVPFASVAAPDALVSVIVAESVGFVFVSLTVTDANGLIVSPTVTFWPPNVPAISGATGVGVGAITSKLVFVSLVVRLDVVSVTSSQIGGFRSARLQLPQSETIRRVTQIGKCMKRSRRGYRFPHLFCSIPLRSAAHQHPSRCHHR